MSKAATETTSPHIPVLLKPLLAAVAPVSGRWLDGTFGAGGYTRGLLEAGADKVCGVDRDPLAFDMAEDWIGDFAGRIEFVADVFSNMDAHAQDLDGVVLDLGVSSMQLDLAERGFSFMKDGPLDMRMSQSGPSAADLVNESSEEEIADILFHYGEERASRRIARAIVKTRTERPFKTTLELADIIEKNLPRPKPGQSHPATRSFQGLRIAVNNEYGELLNGLMAAERALKPGGLLAVVTFHSIEDRMVKKFMAERAGRTGGGNRYAPEVAQDAPAFELLTRKAVGPDDEELAINPRSRSAKLRVARRTDAPAGVVDGAKIGMPMLGGQKRGRK
ncbi:16S rRNA (cytosine(1402)-N(4))-methyltransferase RsmH [Cognatishimia sp.]|uniref:16S rRNA (cytosine(1402)-N(4))-methyltransferase RsmH n=1 Tax=Cognatishimia sp. TaxID=2211648 RepID=UPI003515E140|nr:16S rRNA (cytosine(1402)-N(4))-methyltransferase RsmH [Cognatishimia sp.]